jgi:hypothetical protein
MKVLVSSYPKGSILFPRDIPENQTIAEKVIHLIMGGSLPSIVEYPDIINILWKSLDIAGIDLNVSSTLYEALIATMCRNKRNIKERFGISYGRNMAVGPTDYIQLNTADAVANLSTFSGMIFEDIDAMVANGVANTINEVEEPISPLEKIIHY